MKKIELTPENVLCAYLNGIFPWPMEKGTTLMWCSPDPRGVLYKNKFRINKSFHKFLKKHSYLITHDQAFTEVMKFCAVNSKRAKDDGFWITQEMIDTYSALFDLGFAYSIEVWEKNDNGKELVGGLYGVKIHNYISAESMFHTRDYTSKLALHALMKRMEGWKIDWVDIQMVTPILETLGADYIDRATFLKNITDHRILVK